MSLTKYARRKIVSTSGRIPWTRREIEAWLLYLKQTYAETESEFDLERETVFFLNDRYGQKSILWLGRALAIINFIVSFRNRLTSDGYMDADKNILSDRLIDALARLPITNHHTGFAYASVQKHILHSQRAN